MMDKYPILYSFRRCPYAMRARMAIYQANIKCEYREVLLKDKPESMMSLSSKGTVPVLLTPDDTIIDQSLDVMLWALHQDDPDDWLNEDVHWDKPWLNVMTMNSNTIWIVINITLAILSIHKNIIVTRPKTI